MYKTVRIINSHLPTYWYSSMIGELYKVSEGVVWGEHDDWVVEDGRWPENMEPSAGRAFIKKSDCEIVNETIVYNGQGIKHRFI